MGKKQGRSPIAWALLLAHLPKLKPGRRESTPTPHPAPLPRKAALLMRRTILLMATMALTLLVASGVALTATTTFSNPSSIGIVDATQTAASPASLYPSEINVQGLSDPISDVNVTLNGYT